jgi:hypothetical protein
LTHIETLKVALNALSNLRLAIYAGESIDSQAREAIAILQAALTEQSEPVAWLDKQCDYAYSISELMGDDPHPSYIPLFTHPASKQPEPFKSFGEAHPANPNAKCKCEHWQSCVECHPTAHPPKQPKPLTDNEIEDYGFTMLPNVAQGEFIDFARSIEAAVYARRAK